MTRTSSRRRTTSVARWLGLASALLAVSLDASGRTTTAADAWDVLGLPPPSSPSAVHPGRIVVKYRPTVDACVDCLLAQRTPLATITGRDSLDRLHRELGVVAARPVFAAARGLRSGRAAAYFAHLDHIRQRFFRRSARIPAAAQPPDLSNVYVLALAPGTDVVDAAARYGADPDVEYAEPDWVRHVTFTPNDPFFSSSGTWGQSYLDLWGMHITQAPAAWDIARGNGTVIAVIDTGVDATHPDLAANIWTNPLEIPGNGIDDDQNGYVDDVHGWDFVRNDNDPNDEHYHGTHVAGTAAAVGNNGVGVVGMAWGSRVMIVRGLDENGSGSDTDLAACIVYAAENGADVLNASWGGVGSSQVLSDAIATAKSLGAVFIAAAGNDGGDTIDFFPANDPNTIAVGAMTPDDERAGFSNFGDALSVAAPGVDVLSLKAAVAATTSSLTAPTSGVVATNYLRLSGTSMASPHVAGLAAVLLSEFPGLTPDEVRAHLEFNADQLGYPGYEGALWNPYLGFGRIDASRVFDPPPPGPFTIFRNIAIDLHVLPEMVVPDATHVRFSFTNGGSIPWSLSSPSWLPVASGGATSGSGGAAVSFDLDATGLAPGLYVDPVVVDAPTATDGGASQPATLQVHRDERIGGEILVSPTTGGTNNFIGWPPRVASDGVGTLVVWGRFMSGGNTPSKLVSVRIDGAGVPTPPAIMDPDLQTLGSEPAEPGDRLAIGFDGRNFLVAWVDWDRIDEPRIQDFKSVKAMRVAPDGQLLDLAPIVVAREKGFSDGIYAVDIGFDGESYVVVWTRERQTNSSLLGQAFVLEQDYFYTRRVGIDGTLRSRARKIYKRLTVTDPFHRLSPPKVACVHGGCLVAWREGEILPGPRYLKNLFAAPLGSRRLAAPPRQVLSKIDTFAGLATDGTGYLALADRPPLGTCLTNFACAPDVIAAQISAAGVPSDPAGVGVSVNNPPNAGAPDGLHASSLTFDGTDYVAVFIADAVSGLPYCPFPTLPEICRRDTGYQIFANRLAPDGSIRDQEAPGLLFHPLHTAVEGSTFIAATGTHHVLTWTEHDTSIAIHPYALFAERLLAHPRVPAFPELTVGAIGPQTVAERSVLGFTLTAGPTATLSATNLPPGAIFDAATRTFRWVPSANEAGLYPSVHFQVNDGAQSAGEDVTITVTEANLSLGGTVRLGNTTPVPGVALDLSGMRGGKRTAISDAAGRYHFDDLVPGAFNVKLAGQSTHDYLAAPVRRSVTLQGTDRRDVDFVLTPH